MGKLRRLYKTDRAQDFDHKQVRSALCSDTNAGISDCFMRARQIYETIDRQSYQWLVVFVADVGFFLDGYTLFASNIGLPMISYVYWKDETSSIKTTCINIATLAGTVFGQLLFGFLADKKGRKRVYGIELTVLIFSTVFLVMASTGVNDNMSIYLLLILWRFIVGVGVGAGCPLSAIITSE
ncbi:uncharacterized protein N7477_008971 [Penicillium maclennaniae]|uniref:uncharacterized protein n=1 Tax=Penicillium maclennaniae TaxID=1343394 RepID=UPI002541EE18|nr:uncharacterized protein N7477_008971 [Penicillium maclennaniae]KAJ5666523.1 hypothetical protein N7477_008971 [Penicillium maclennaniae]